MKTSSMLTLALLFLYVPPANARDFAESSADNLTPAALASKADNYREQLIKKPTDARVRYLLGDVLFRQKRFSAALQQFQAAMNLDKDGEIAKLSTKYIESIYEQNPETKTSTISEIPARKASIAADKIAKQLSSKSKSLAKELETQLTQIRSEYDDRVRNCFQYTQTKIDANGPPVSRGRIVYDPESNNQALRAQRDATVQSLRTEEQKRIDNLTALYRAKQAAVEDSTLDTVQPNKVKAPFKSTSGTDHNVRNYQTSDEAARHNTSKTPPSIPPTTAIKHAS